MPARDVFTEEEKKEFFNEVEDCPKCLGSGIDIIFGYRKMSCPQCQGGSYIKDLVTCDECGGIGKVKEGKK